MSSTPSKQPKHLQELDELIDRAPHLTPAEFEHLRKMADWCAQEVSELNRHAANAKRQAAYWARVAQEAQVAQARLAAVLKDH